MKTKIFILVFILFVCFTKNDAKAGIPVVYSDGEEIEKILELPREGFKIQADNGRWYHANLGVLHKQFSICGIPLFNYGTEKYVLYTDTKIGNYDYTYIDLTQSDIADLQREFGGISSTPELPFWDAWGGKLLVLLLIGGYFFFKQAS